MSDTRGQGSDPSMDDILASIRKIISDDEARAQGSGAASSASKPPGAPPSSATLDDVLLLTDLLDEPKTAPSLPPQPTLVPSPAKVDPVSAAKATEPSIMPDLPPATPPLPAALAPPASAAKPVAAVEPSVKPPPADRSLVEPGTADLAAAAFDRLNEAVQESVPQPAAIDPGPSVGPSGRNLEDIVKELVRPMLKEWLDKNLPAMVERFVEREIVRLTRR